MNWEDKRDLLMLSTKHDSRMIEILHLNTVKTKPQLVANYNTENVSIDLVIKWHIIFKSIEKELKVVKKSCDGFIT